MRKERICPVNIFLEIDCFFFFIFLASEVVIKIVMVPC